jgi:hypothetical protein
MGMLAYLLKFVFSACAEFTTVVFLNTKATSAMAITVRIDFVYKSVFIVL